MTMVIDPVCGMRIDPEDAVATAEHHGQSYWFCSEGCRDVFAVDPEPDRDRLSEAELARRSGTSAERVHALVELGILESDEARTFPRRDVMRARLFSHFELIGFELADLAQAVRSGHLTLGYLEASGRQHPLSDRSHADLAADVGLPFETLERIFVGFGLRRPDPDEPVRQEDLAVLNALKAMTDAGVGEKDLLRLARVWGDSARRVAEYLPHHFHAAVEEPFRRRGLGDNQAYEAAIRDVGMRSGRSGEDLLGWLFRRHSEIFMAAHQLEHVETALEDAGVRRRPPRVPEAAVFADLTGYTRLTEESGDENAADTALAFAQLVNEVVADHRGSVVKLLGDGALLHFADPGDAVRASLDLTERAPAHGLPPTHIGINAGPMLYDHGDYFGRTVNTAARIAAEAGSGRVYVGESVAEVAAGEGFTLHRVGVFELKGVAEPMTLYEAIQQPARRVTLA